MSHDKVDAPILVRPVDILAAIHHGYVLGYIHASLSEVDEDVPSFMVVDKKPSDETEEWIKSMHAALMSAKIRKDGTRRLPFAASHVVESDSK